MNYNLMVPTSAPHLIAPKVDPQEDFSTVRAILGASLEVVPSASALPLPQRGPKKRMLELVPEASLSKSKEPFVKKKCDADVSSDSVESVPPLRLHLKSPL